MIHNYVVCNKKTNKQTNKQTNERTNKGLGCVSKSINQSINQSINYSFNRSYNAWIDQFIKWSLHTCLLTARHFAVDPVDKIADSGKHGVVISAALRMSPTDSTAKHPAATFLTNERSSTVSLTASFSLSTGADHGTLIHGNQTSVYTWAVGMSRDRQHSLL